MLSYSLKSSKKLGLYLAEKPSFISLWNFKKIKVHLCFLCNVQHTLIIKDNSSDKLNMFLNEVALKLTKKYDNFRASRSRVFTCIQLFRMRLSEKKDKRASTNLQRKSGYPMINVF